MRNRLVFGILALVFSIMVFLVIRPYWMDDGEQKNNTLKNPTVNKLQVQNNQRTNRNLLKIDMISANEKVQDQLITSKSVNFIPHNNQDKTHYFKNEAIVNFKMPPSKTQIKQFCTEINGVVKEHHDTTYMFKSNSLSATELEHYFSKKPSVEYVEPHYIFMQNQVNDTYYQGYQWNLPAIGTDYGWQITRGSKDIKIAVVDTGVDMNHPDLKQRLVQGYNAINDSNVPEDDNGHGSHVAGIIASETNNAEGVAGITWFNPIIPVKAMGADGTGGSYYVSKGIRWAVDHGAKVINLSLGVYQACDVMESAIDYALEKDVVVIAAAGNDHTSQPSYPAAYPGVLGVSAVDVDGSPAEFTNYGNYIDVAAPGVDIPSTFSKGRYAALSGTSMAAPHVTALAGLIRSVNPKLKNSEVVDIITHSTISPGRMGSNPYYGNGIIDIEKAVQMARDTLKAAS